MPLFKKLKLTNSQVLCIWDIQENEEFFLNTLASNRQYINSLSRIKNPQKRLQYLSARKLLYDLRITNITHNEYGAILPVDGIYISISHSFNYVGVIIGKKPFAIDIEKVRSKIIDIADKFVHPTEVSFINKELDYQKMLTKIWVAKEAVFKIYQTSLSFKNQIKVMPFKLEDKIINVSVEKRGKLCKHQIKFIPFENFYCGYTI